MKANHTSVGIAILAASAMLTIAPAVTAAPNATFYLRGSNLAPLAKQWESDDHSNPKSDASFFMGFVVGVYDTAGGLCVPMGVKINQLCEITAQYLRTHPGELESDAHSLVTKALTQAYPCGNESRAAPVPPILPDPPRAYPPPPRAAVPRAPRRSTLSTGCESGHWIDSVSDDGEIIKLEDGSVWEVEAGDSVTSSLWLPITDVLVCEAKGKIINTDDNESVAVTRLK